MKGNIDPKYSLEVRRLIGGYFREMREDKKLSQQDLAEKMGIKQETVSKIEAGKWNYTLDMITLFCLHLDCFLFFIPKDSGSDLETQMRNRWNRKDQDI